MLSVHLLHRLTAPVRCEVCSLGCPSWLVLLFMSLLSFTCSCGGMVWFQVCGPSCCSGVLGSWGLYCAVMSPWPMVAPSPSVVSRWVSSFGVCLDLGWKAAVLPSFGGELSFPCPGCFHLAVLTVWLSRLLEFFLNSFLGFFPLASSFC